MEPPTLKLDSYNSLINFCRLLNYSMSRVRLQDSMGVIESVSQNPRGQQLVWDFVREKWPLLQKK